MDQNLKRSMFLLITIFVCGCGKQHPITESSLERKGRLGPWRIYKVTLRRNGSAIYVGTMFLPSRKSNPALATDLEPVYVRLLPRF